MEDSRRAPDGSGTRAAVLEATVGLLAERGYAGTSTRLAAERAGVSLGALQHHFRSKAELSVEAMRHLTRQLAEEFVASIPGQGSDLDRFGEALDRLYVVFRGPTFAAAVELQLAARTDAELRDPIRNLHAEVEQTIRRSAATLLPELGDLPGFESLLLTSTSAIRGLALNTMEPVGDPSGSWPELRDSLVDLASGLVGSADR